MFPSKLPDVGVTIFTVMSRLAADHGAVNLGQGFPDFDPDRELLDLVSQAMVDGHNQYAFMPGIPELREVIAAKTQALYGMRYDPDTEITVTSGATQALMTAIQTCVQPGDEVIVLEPNYDSYVPAIRLAGGIPVPVALTPPSPEKPGFSPDWNRVRAAITSRTRLLIVNFPHNPTGAVLSESDLDALEDLIVDNDIYLISDEVYEHIVFDGVQHASLARRHALAARCFLVSSFGKTFHTTGWKIGYCLAPAAMTREFRKVHQFTVFSVSTPMQVGIAQFLKNPDHYQNLSAFYQQKRDELAQGLSQSRFRVLPSPGTFFLMADYSDISRVPEADFAKWLTTEHGVAVIPVSAFYANPDAAQSNHHLVRFCFAKRSETLKTAIAKLASL